MTCVTVLLGMSLPGVCAYAQDAPHPDDQPVITVSPGVGLRELIGRSVTSSLKTSRSSVALFHLDAGAASAWSFTKTSEEVFLILNGHGEVWLDSRPLAVKPGSFVLVPPHRVRSVRASKGEALDFYAVTTPAWSSVDDVLVAPPAGAPR